MTHWASVHETMDEGGVLGSLEWRWMAEYIGSGIYREWHDAGSTSLVHITQVLYEPVDKKTREVASILKFKERGIQLIFKGFTPQEDGGANASFTLQWPTGGALVDRKEIKYSSVLSPMRPMVSPLRSLFNNAICFFRNCGPSHDENHDLHKYTSKHVSLETLSRGSKKTHFTM